MIHLFGLALFCKAGRTAAWPLRSFPSLGSRSRLSETNTAKSARVPEGTYVSSTAITSAYICWFENPCMSMDFERQNDTHVPHP